MWLSLSQWTKQHNFAWKFKLIVCLPILSFLILFDWISKWVVVAKMTEGEVVDFIPGFLHFQYKINPGAAYGMNSGNPALAISLATIVTVFLIVVFIFINDKKWLIALTFLVSGSFANLFARAWSPPTTDGVYGGVVDFLQWEFSWLNSDGYIFNLADVWVIVGIVLLVIALIWEIIAAIIVHSQTKKEDDQDDGSNPTSKESNGNRN